MAEQNFNQLTDAPPVSVDGPASVRDGSTGSNKRHQWPDPRGSVRPVWESYRPSTQWAKEDSVLVG